jgi:hypothetical protein
MLVQAELANWFNNVEEMIESESIEGTGNDGGKRYRPQTRISTEHTVLLRILHHESTIALNRPLMTSTANKAASAAALQNCISSSRSIISILEDFRLTSESHVDTATRLQIPFLWPLCTWCAWMSCFILAYAAMESHSMIPSAQRYVRNILKEFIPDNSRYAQKTLNILEHLSLRRTVWPVSCADAVKQLTLALSAKVDPPTPRSGHDSYLQMRQSPNTASPDLATGNFIKVISIQAH